ncbi:MAG: helicase-associated domain-containing protein [Treponema sp.]|nr:helicase-associated domain-containing protein [Treponema sp.]
MQIQNQDLKVQRIIRWRETLATMNEERFFEIMRIYIGEIHTPYNKDKLIEQLSSIFRKEQNKQRIISYLSSFDIKIITAVSFVKDATKEKLIDFFKNEYSLSDIYSELLNLNERLIIYSYRDENDQIIIDINPLLDEILTPYKNLSRLLTSAEYAQRVFDTTFSITPQFLAAFICYVIENPELCKNNTTLKKKDADKLEQIFPERSKTISLLLNAFINLRIFVLGEKEISVDENRLISFASCPESYQYAYLSTASIARLGREGLRSQSQLLLDIASSIPTEGLTLSSVLRIAFLISNKARDISDRPVQGRFSKMLSNHRSDSMFEFSGALIEQIIHSAIEFGFFTISGYTETQEPILVPGPIFNPDKTQTSSDNKKGILNINAGTSITILPGLSLQEYLPLIRFMNIKSCNTVSEYEISRKSISRAFDKNISTQDIISLLEKYSAYNIPQSLEINIEEWRSSYFSAIMYKGYVLKVDDKNERVIENNPKISSKIQTKLAPGVFLLNIQQDEDAELFIKNCGLEFMGNVKTPSIETEMVVFPPLVKGKSFVPTSLSQEEQEELEKNEIKLLQESNQFKTELLQSLDKMELSKQQKECLTTRIERNVILFPEQLNPNTVRLEILEADGMNYAGKIHLVENAIKNGDLVQFTIPSDQNPQEMQNFLGRPISIAKQTNDTLVKVQLQTDSADPFEQIHIYSLSKTNYIKIIRTSIFKM